MEGAEDARIERLKTLQVPPTLSSLASDLPRSVNKFQRDWLADIYLAAITHEAVTKEIGLSEAATALEEGKASLPLDEVLSVVFQTVTEAGDEEEEARITGQLRRLITDPAILSVIRLL